jgi:hypothetical protein
MYNEQFLQDVIWKHGIDQAIIFCQLESDKYNKQFNEMKAGDPIAHQELQYERDWWAERAEKLKNDEPC